MGDEAKAANSRKEGASEAVKAGDDGMSPIRTNSATRKTAFVREKASGRGEARNEEAEDGGSSETTFANPRKSCVPARILPLSTETGWDTSENSRSDTMN
jgi:hypothetical protein